MTDPTIDMKTRRRVNPFVALVIVALLAMWGYVVYLAFFVGRADSPDKIDEPAFVSEAETRCAEALAFVETLPLPETQVGDHVARAETVAEATAEFEAMVVDLRGMADRLVDDPESAEIVSLWLADWDTVVADRFDYAERLRADPEARLLVTPGPNGRQVSLQVDEFAGTNDMPSCKSPLDA